MEDFLIKLFDIVRGRKKLYIVNRRRTKMKNFWLWIALLILACGLIILWMAGEAHGDSFDLLPGLGYTRTRNQPTLENIARAREILNKERAPRNGYVLAIMLGEEILTVPVDASGESRLPGVAVRRISKNGVNSRFEVLAPEDGVVLALRRNVRGTGVVYTPWSPALDTLALRENGLVYLKTLLERVSPRVKTIPSAFWRNKSVGEVISGDIILTLIFVEHLDGGRLNFNDNLPYELERSLVVFGANESGAFRYSRSRVGARGIGQIMPVTYMSVRHAYPLSRLPMSFLLGVADHESSVLTMYCALDAVLAHLSSWQRRGLFARGNELNLGLYLAAAYNAGGSNARRVFNRYNFMRRYARERAELTYLGKFEAVWNLR